jgi:uncharacterized membrane protein YecN with MAPEG domain
VTGLWGSLIPLIVGGALVPIQIIITTLLLRSKAGRITAVAWVAGMTTVRLAQGIVFGLLLGSASGSGSTSGEPATAVSLLLLVLAIVFYVSAAKQVMKHPDEDAPPPKWMAMLDGIRPSKAYLLGVGLLAIGAKPWVFTLGAIAAIGDAGLDQGVSIVTFLVFVVLTESIHLLVLGVAYALPDRSAALLDRVTGFFETYNRLIVIVLGLVFGTWFLVKALGGLGLL